MSGQKPHHHRHQRVCWRALAAILLLTSAAQGTYDPHHGRWFQRDPLGVRPDAPRGLIGPRIQYGDRLSMHEYVHSQPTRGTDPTGLWNSDMHHDATYQAATGEHVEMKHECTETIAKADQDVDETTIPLFFPEYHWNFALDLLSPTLSKRLDRGRDYWYGKRWSEGEEILRKARLHCDWPTVSQGLKKIGQALHSMQDASSHSPSHQADTPFDHAPSVVCFFLGDWFGEILPLCKEAKKANPNWDEPHRPDDKIEWDNDFYRTSGNTAFLLSDLMKIPSVRCHCHGRSDKEKLCAYCIPKN